jgi:putrescine aminotransferase
LTNKKLFSVEDCEKLTNKEIRELYKKHVNPTLEKLWSSFSIGEVEVDHAEGVWIYTKNNEKILDVTGGIGVLSHGHNHPRILKMRIDFQKKKRMEVHKTIFSPYLAALSHNLSKLLPGDLDYTFLCNSGAEAVEGAVKLAYKYHDGKRKHILHSDISFHGKLLGSGTISASKEVYFKYPQIPNAESFEYNNIDSVKEKIKKLQKESGESDVYALIIEPFQVGTFKICSTQFLKDLQKICNENNIVLIFDEIYTGWYKTGYMFNFMSHNVLPDILTTSKSFGGGKASISAYISRAPILKKSYGTNLRDALLHTSTYNGFGEECATAMEAINIMQEENYQEKSFNIERIVKKRCNQLTENFSGQIKEHRGSGALHGIFFKADNRLIGKILELIPISITKDGKFIPKLVAAAISDWMYRNYKILVILTNTDEIALFFKPSLVINEDEINYFFDSLESTLEKGIWQIVLKFVLKQVF